MLQLPHQRGDSSRMRIKSYKDLVGLSIAQARAAFDAVSYEIGHTDINEVNGKSWKDLYVNARHTIDRLSDEKRQTADEITALHLALDQALQNTATLREEVDRLTKVIASYDTPEELRTARDFIKAFNVDVAKVEQMDVDHQVQLGREVMDEDRRISEALAKSEAADRLTVVVPENAPAGEKPSTDSLQKVWTAIRGTKRGLPADHSKWTRRRLAQLNRLKELGYAQVGLLSGSWWGIEPGPKPDET